VAQVRSFRAVRYAGPVSLDRLLAPPYDVVSPTQREALASDPANVVHLELPLDEEGESSRYAVAARRLQSWLSSGLLARDLEPSLYPYRQTFVHEGHARERRGVFGLVELVPPGPAGGIFPHEYTLSGPREDRLRLLRATRTSLSPVFLLYEDPSGEIRERLASAEETPRLATVRTSWGTEETLSRWSGEGARRVASLISGRPLVFADGHHRYESALRYAEEQDASGGGREIEAGPPPHRYALAVLVELSDPGIVVLPTHRIVSADAFAPGPEWSRLLESGFESQPFSLEGGDAQALRRSTSWLEEQGSASRTAFVLARAGAKELTGLTLRELGRDRLFDGSPNPRSLRDLDVVVLHALLERGLGITPEAIRDRAALSYTRDAAEAVAATRRGAGAAFLLNATPVVRVVELAREGHRLPQKSTYFEPKLTSGWVFHVHGSAEEVWGIPSRGAGALFKETR
jgi:uncharacterized protein (DUF1015 family)